MTVTRSLVLFLAAAHSGVFVAGSLVCGGWSSTASAPTGTTSRAP
jgi:hypothetical protein